MNVWDGSKPVSTSEISYLDLIGQPTWIAIKTVNVKTVLRSGIVVGSHFKIPPTLMTTSADSFSPMYAEQKKNLAFTGDFICRRVLHVGDFRNPDGANWCTNYEGINQGETTGAPVEPPPPTPPQGQPNITVRVPSTGQIAR